MPLCLSLFDDFRDDACADGLAALADGKRRPCSIATGVIKVTTIFTLSPGITISVALRELHRAGHIPWCGSKTAAGSC